MGNLVAYMDFKGGLNDTSSPHDLEDNELLQADNIDLDERGGFNTRKGIKPINTASYGTDIVKAFEWIIGTTTKIIAIFKETTEDCNSVLYEIDPDNGNKTKKQVLKNVNVGHVVVGDKLYIADGEEIYVWGDFDYYSSEGKVDINKDHIVRKTPKSYTATLQQDDGNFYKALSDLGEVDLSSEDFTNTSRWKNVTEVKNKISSVIRTIKPHDSSQKEKAKVQIKSPPSFEGDIRISIGDNSKTISVTGKKEVAKLIVSSGATKTENITIVLDAQVYFVVVYAGEDKSDIASRIRSFPYKGYETSGTGSTVIFTATTLGKKGKSYFSGGETGVSASMSITTQGSADSEEAIATKIKNTVFSGFLNTQSETSVYFEADEPEITANLVVDSNSTGVALEYYTIREGKENDCNLNPIKKCTMFSQHPKSLRVFCSGNPDDPTALYFSEYNHMEYFKAINVLYPSTSEGAVTGIAPLYQDMLVSYNNSWWHFRGIDPETDASWEQLPIPYGCVSHDSIVLTPFSLTFLGRAGIYNISASIINQDIVMMQSKQMIHNLTEGKAEKIIQNIENPRISQGVFHDNKYYLAYCDDTENPNRNNKVLLYNWEVKGFTRYTNLYINSWISRFNGELFFTSKNYILKANEGDCDIDVETGEDIPIHLFVKTKHYDLKNVISSKFVSRLFLFFKQNTQQQSVPNIMLKGDYERLFLSKDVNIAQSLVHGRKWGKIWGYADLVANFSFVNKIALRYQLTIENNRLNDPIAMYGLGFEYRNLRPRMIISDEGGELLK